MPHCRDQGYYGAEGRTQEEVDRAGYADPEQQTVEEALYIIGKYRSVLLGTLEHVPGLGVGHHVSPRVVVRGAEHLGPGLGPAAPPHRLLQHQHQPGGSLGLHRHRHLHVSIIIIIHDHYHNYTIIIIGLTCLLLVWLLVWPQS